MLVADLIARFAVSLLPVVIFLLALTLLDTYKLVALRTLARGIAAGCLVAVASLGVNALLMRAFGLEATPFARYGAPLVEEVFKGAFVVYMIATRRVGFMVDAAIAGFAIGTGFAIVENTWYAGALDTSNVVVWVVRGFGTAVMHGGTTAILAIATKSLHDRGRGLGAAALPGLGAAIVIHSFYNHFLLSPVLQTVLLYVTLPPVILYVFYRSERSTRAWLGDKLDVDAELLEMISTGRVTETRIGRYFQTLRDSFPPEMVFDMVCYLRVHVELAISAKGVLMMREAGFDAAVPPGTREKFDELRHLESAVGRTGLLALSPFLHATSRDRWQLRMLEKQVR